MPTVYEEGKRFHLCTKADPWTPEKGEASIHPEAREMRNFLWIWFLGLLSPLGSKPCPGKKPGTTVVWCPHCGETWDGDASEVARAVAGQAG